MSSDITLYTAFVAGLISFLSPCVLPLVPGYVSFISGVSIEDMRAESRPLSLLNYRKWPIMLNSTFFVFGFSAVFILLGASATWIGRILSSELTFFTKGAGLIIIVFGLFKTGLIRPLAFYKTRAFQVKKKRFGLLGAFLIGAAFAFGWTPCIGPILGGILAYAGTLEHVKQGVGLLLVYSSGMGIPFLLAAIGINQFLRLFKRFREHMGLVEKISGVIMVIVGLMILTDTLTLIPGYLTFLNKFAL